MGRGREMGERPGGRYLRDTSGPPLVCVCGPHMAATVGTMPCGMQRPVMQFSKMLERGQSYSKETPKAAERDLEEEDTSDPKKERGVKPAKRSWPNVSRVSKVTTRLAHGGAPKQPVRQIYVSTHSGRDALSSSTGRSEGRASPRTSLPRFQRRPPDSLLLRLLRRLRRSCCCRPRRPD